MNLSEAVNNVNSARREYLMAQAEHDMIGSLSFDEKKYKTAKLYPIALRNYANALDAYFDEVAKSKNIPLIND